MIKEIPTSLFNGSHLRRLTNYIGCTKKGPIKGQRIYAMKIVDEIKGDGNHKAEIARIHKNKNEDIVIGFESFLNSILLQIRTHALVGGEYRPTKKGISISIDKLSEFFQAIKKAENAAYELGLLDQSKENS